MAQFDMRGQKVTHQYNAVGDINFGVVENTFDLVAELEKLKGEFDKSEETDIIGEDTATDAKYQVSKAIQQAKKHNPDKKTILDHLNAAKALIEDITAASSLVTALFSAIEIVRKLFP